MGASTPTPIPRPPPEPLRFPRDAVLLTVDAQRGFDQLPGRNNPGLERNIQALHAAWRKAGRPLIHVRHDSVFPESVLRPNQPGNDLKPEAAPQGDEPVVRKNVHSSFIGTDLEGRLRRLGAHTLVILGIQTNYCVATTARMASNLGYKTYVVGDACATFDLPLLDGSSVTAQVVHDMALAELQEEFATVVSTKDVVAAAPK